MAIYHLHISNGSKAQGKSAATRFDYVTRQQTFKKDTQECVFSESKNLPSWASSERDFWSAADRFERANARVYKEVEFALPRELHAQDRIALARDFARDLTHQHGLPYTLAIHDGKGTNPHAHLMICERGFDGVERTRDTFFKRANTKSPHEGGAAKVRELNHKQWVHEVREQWAVSANVALEQHRHPQRIDHRSYEARGIDITPQIHLGVQASAMAQRGIPTERLEQFQAIARVQHLEKQLHQLKQEHSRERAPGRTIASSPSEHERANSSHQRQAQPPRLRVQDPQHQRGNDLQALTGHRQTDGPLPSRTQDPARTSSEPRRAPSPAQRTDATQRSELDRPTDQLDPRTVQDPKQPDSTTPIQPGSPQNLHPDAVSLRHGDDVRPDHLDDRLQPLGSDRRSPGQADQNTENEHQARQALDRWLGQFNAARANPHPRPASKPQDQAPRELHGQKDQHVSPDPQKALELAQKAIDHMEAQRLERIIEQRVQQLEHAVQKQYPHLKPFEPNTRWIHGQVLHKERIADKEIYIIHGQGRVAILANPPVVKQEHHIDPKRNKLDSKLVHSQNAPEKGAHVKFGHTKSGPSIMTDLQASRDQERQLRKQLSKDIDYPSF